MMSNGPAFENVPVEEITYALSADDAAKRLGMNVGTFRGLMSQLNGTELDLRAPARAGERARQYDLHRLDEWKGQGMPRPAMASPAQDARPVTATAERVGKFWRVMIEDTGQETTADNLRHARELVLALASEALETPAAGLSVQLTPTLPAAAREGLEAARESEREAQRLASEAAQVRRQAVRDLRAQGFSIDDLAELLALSRQRVSQLAQGPA